MSAKQRRVNGPPAPIQTQQPAPPQPNRPGNVVDMTLPMVLQLLETRLRKLEGQTKEPQENLVAPQTQVEIQEIVSEWKDFQSEYDTRFNILATEINQLKDIVLKLQAYTMDVNKTLLEERVHFLSEEKENIVFSSTAED
jgi:hypothetical protein